MDEQKNMEYTRTIADLLVSDVLNRRGIRPDREIPAEQKEQMKRLVEDLQRQVNDFLSREKEANKDAE